MRFSLPAAILLTTAILNSQTGRPNFSGTWEPDRPDGKAGQELRAVAGKLVVAHKEPHLKYIWPGRDRNQEFNLTTDGVDQVRDQPEGESRMSARWDGTVLEIRSFLKTVKGELTSTDRWSLDRGVLTIQTHATLKPADASAPPHVREVKLQFRKRS